MRSLKFLLMSIPLVAVVGCGSESDSEKAYKAAQTALNKAQTAYTAAGLRAAQEASFATTANCSGGGMLGVNANVSGQQTTGGAAGGFNMDVTFDDCVEEGLTMKGSLNYRLDFATSGDPTMPTGATVEFKITGNLSYTGLAEVSSCEFNMTASINSTGNSGSAQISGTVCGEDISGAEFFGSQG